MTFLPLILHTLRSHLSHNISHIQRVFLFFLHNSFELSLWVLRFHFRCTSYLPDAFFLLTPLISLVLRLVIPSLLQFLFLFPLFYPLLLLLPLPLLLVFPILFLHYLISFTNEPSPHLFLVLFILTQA